MQSLLSRLSSNLQNGAISGHSLSLPFRCNGNIFNWTPLYCRGIVNFKYARSSSTRDVSHTSKFKFFRHFTSSPILSKTATGYQNYDSVQRRNFHVQEYQALDLMTRHSIPCPFYRVARTIEEIHKSAKELEKESGDIVVKAQILAGGRGLGTFKENEFKGGVHLCESAQHAIEVAEKMLGNTLVTKQTGPNGMVCNAVMLAERFFIRREKYVAFLMDRPTGGPIFLGSSYGGTSIEEVAKSHPNSILQIPIDIRKGLTKSQGLEIAKLLGFMDQQIPEVSQCLLNLYDLFIKNDCLLVEVNPFIETHNGKIMVCDSKLNFDENAAFRQQEIFTLRDTQSENSREVTANSLGLNYVALDGNIGCMVNGAGLAMATMDLIQKFGGSPANFLDVGGGADQKQIVEAFRLLQDDPSVRVIMINIFGGIMRCDIIALGIIAASQEVGLTKPLIIRLEGTNQDVAKELLDDSGLRMIYCSNFEQAAQKAVKVVEILALAKKAALDVSFAL